MFSRQVVGSKSLNLAKLRPSLPSEIVTPQAVALPYGCLQKTLTHPDNKKEIFEALAKCLGQLEPNTPNSEANEIFQQARRLITRLKWPEEFNKELTTCMESSGVTGDRSLIELYEKWGANAAWKSICDVWASLFGLRPWVSGIFGN